MRHNNNELDSDRETIAAYLIKAIIRRKRATNVSPPPKTTASTSGKTKATGIDIGWKRTKCFDEEHLIRLLTRRSVIFLFVHRHGERSFEKLA